MSTPTIYGHGRAAGHALPAWVSTVGPDLDRSEFRQGIEVSRPTFGTVADHYRTLRRAGLPAWHTRHIISSLLWAGAQCSLFSTVGRERLSEQL